MHHLPYACPTLVRLLALVLAFAIPGCAPAASSTLVTSPPILSMWPDPIFLPDRQCRGKYVVEDLTRYLPRARLALWLPGTRSVTVDPARRCITVIVESVGDGRLAELVMRGVSIPRRAVLLALSSR